MSCPDGHQGQGDGLAHALASNDAEVALGKGPA